MRYRHHNEQSDAELGFERVQHWIGYGIKWVFYIIFFPIIYPLRELGKKRRAELDAEPAYNPPTTSEILAQARKRK